MNAPLLGLLLGVACGAIAVATMLPMKFPDRRAALTAAFVSRFMIGLFTATVAWPLPVIATGAIVGLLVSIPDALITKVYAPILGMGVVFGLLSGVAVTYLAP